VTREEVRCERLDHPIERARHIVAVERVQLPAKPVGLVEDVYGGAVLRQVLKPFRDGEQ
jgi:hypothetical protein